jgi:enterochelin esterase family protein
MKALLHLLVCTIGTIGFSQGSTNLQQEVGILYKAGLNSDSLTRANAIDSVWNSLRLRHQIPLVVGDSVAFLYRGEAKTVAWLGDFNGWGYAKQFNTRGVLIPGTNIWILKASFPRDSRFDYKIFINATTWILDPENSHQQWSGVGGGSPNSQLQMPDWKEDVHLQVRPAVPHGKVVEDILFNSTVLGYQLTYSVYIAPGVDSKVKVPSLYVTDGYEYMTPKLGNMITVLDNLLAEKKIKPLVVIFIDHREPVNRANNKRMDELAMNPKYLDFFVKEFIPFIESSYPVIPSAETRGILGTSMGGLSAAYFSFSQPGVFGMAGIQSPAFSIRPQIFLVCNSPNHPMKVSMTSGMFYDTSDATRKMKEILQSNACEYHYREVNDGQSWGNWRNLLDDILIDLYGYQ